MLWFMIFASNIYIMSVWLFRWNKIELIWISKFYRSKKMPWHWPSPWKQKTVFLEQWKHFWNIFLQNYHLRILLNPRPSWILCSPRWKNALVVPKPHHISFFTPDLHIHWSSILQPWRSCDLCIIYRSLYHLLVFFVKTTHHFLPCNPMFSTRRVSTNLAYLLRYGTKVHRSQDGDLDWCMFCHPPPTCFSG